MNQTKKAIIAIICVSVIALTSSCASKNATGCPNWTKGKIEQTNKKSV